MIYIFIVFIKFIYLLQVSSTDSYSQETSNTVIISLAYLKDESYAYRSVQV